MKRKQACLLLLLLLILFSACTSTNEEQKVDERELTEENQEESNQAIDYVLTKNEVTDATAVNTKGTILLAYDVQQHDRFRLDEIKKDVKKGLEKQFPNKKIALSDDKKIMLEVTELRSKMEKKKLKQSKLKKEIKKIESLMMEKT